MRRQGEPKAAPAAGIRRPAGGALRIASSDLFADAQEVIIEHEDGQYRLRRTSKGKLILTK